MKKFVLLLFAAFLVLSVQAQVKKVVISTPTVQCEMCKNRIEKYIEHVDGIRSIVVDYKKKLTTVSYIPDRINVEEIKALIATVGYDADDVTAEPDSYKKLPKCCKKPDIPAKDSVAVKPGNK